MEQKLVGLFERYYHSIWGLFIGMVISFIFIVLFVDSFLKTEIPFNVRLLYYSFFLFIYWPIIWFLIRNYFPKCKKSSIGIVIAIISENEKQKLRLKNDFVNRIKELCVSNNLRMMDIVVLNDYQSGILLNRAINWFNAQDEIKKSGRVDNQQYNMMREWEDIKKKTRGHYYIYGDIKERKDAQNKYYLKLNSAVIHSHVNFSISDKIRKEMDQTFPRQISIEENFELRGFQITADMIFYSTEYILGICALVSNDPKMALQIHQTLFNNLQKLNTRTPQQNDIYNKLKGSIAEELTYLGRIEFLTSRDMKKVNDYLDEALKYDPNSFIAIGTRSYLAIVGENDVYKASRWAKKGKTNKDDFTWLYNEAYIDMEKGQYERGFKKYLRLEKITFNNEINTVDECIATDEYLYKSNMNKKQILFILGWLYLKKKNNNPIALEKFENFIKEAINDTSFIFLIKQARLYISIIESEMDLKTK